VGLVDTHVGLIILYTAFNLSFSVWLMKGFIDEIPKEYEEAALVDGYTRMEAFFKIVLPQSATGIAATAVFCFITAWNEYAFALMMKPSRPPRALYPSSSGITDWTAIAARRPLFLLPVAIFISCCARHLLRGVTFRRSESDTQTSMPALENEYRMTFRQLSAGILTPAAYG
jgi:multiple sugar transport system permease protein